MQQVLSFLHIQSIHKSLSHRCIPLNDNRRYSSWTSSTRDVPPVPSLSTLGHGGDGLNNVDGNRIEIEGMEEFLQEGMVISIKRIKVQMEKREIMWDQFERQGSWWVQSKRRKTLDNNFLPISQEVSELNPLYAWHPFSCPHRSHIWVYCYDHSTYLSISVNLQSSARSGVKSRNLRNVVILPLTLFFLQLERDATNGPTLDTLHQMRCEARYFVTETFWGNDSLCHW